MGCSLSWSNFESILFFNLMGLIVTGIFPAIRGRVTWTASEGGRKVKTVPAAWTAFCGHTPPLGAGTMFERTYIRILLMLLFFLEGSN